MLLLLIQRNHLLTQFTMGVIGHFMVLYHLMTDTTILSSLMSQIMNCIIIFQNQLVTMRTIKVIFITILILLFLFNYYSFVSLAVLHHRLFFWRLDCDTECTWSLITRFSIITYSIKYTLREWCRKGPSLSLMHSREPVGSEWWYFLFHRGMEKVLPFYWRRYSSPRRGPWLLPESYTITITVFVDRLQIQIVGSCYWQHHWRDFQLEEESFLFDSVHFLLFSAILCIHKKIHSPSKKWKWQRTNTLRRDT